jgi:hypothetical protein
MIMAMELNMAKLKYSNYKVGNGLIMGIICTIFYVVSPSVCPVVTMPTPMLNGQRLVYKYWLQMLRLNVRMSLIKCLYFDENYS